MKHRPSTVALREPHGYACIIQCCVALLALDFNFNPGLANASRKSLRNTAPNTSPREPKSHRWNHKGKASDGPGLVPELRRWLPQGPQPSLLRPSISSVDPLETSSLLSGRELLEMNIAARAASGMLPRGSSVFRHRSLEQVQKIKFPYLAVSTWPPCVFTPLRRSPKTPCAQGKLVKQLISAPKPNIETVWNYSGPDVDRSREKP